MSKYCLFLVAAKWRRENPKYEDLGLSKCECLEGVYRDSVRSEICPGVLSFLRYAVFTCCMGH